MTRHNNTSGPGGAHFGAFGRPRILRSPEDDDSGGGIVTMTQTEFNQKMKAARLDGEKRRTSEAATTTTTASPSASPAMTPQTIAEIVAATIAGMAAQTQRPTAPAPAAAAPTAPSAHTLPTVQGVVDLFNLRPEQIRQLGPRGVRENLEKLWGMNDELSGVPRRPKPPTR